MQTTQNNQDGAMQLVPVKIYRSDDRLTVAAPMPGLEPEDISVEVKSDGQLVLHGRLRGALKGVNDVLVNEWDPGNYHREVALPVPVDGEAANVTYGNGVVVVVLPLSTATRPAQLSMMRVEPEHGVRIGNTGHFDQFDVPPPADEMRTDIDAQP